ncbi:MAG: methyl-accepting chemotaxis protein [Hyphomicrobiales bacterium]|nr:methyl-accepting chemotaxis protein [Hyphomicrobiales bacterium]
MTASYSYANKFSKIAFKFPAAIIAAGALTALLVGILGYVEIESNITSAVDKRVEIVLVSQKASLSNYLAEIENDLQQKSLNIEIQQALVEFDAAWVGMKNGQQETLQNAYISSNPHKLGEKEKLDFAPEKTLYNEVHKNYHPKIRNFLYARGYYDIFLLNTNGDLIYTVFKELDYATNLRVGEYSNSGLGTVFQKAMKLEAGEQAFDDFKPYAPSHGAAASFIAQPIFSTAGERLGVMAFQMPIANINNTMKTHGNLGETGETFIVGDDGLMRSDSELNEEFKILETKISAPILKVSTSDSVHTSHDELYNGLPSIMSVINLEFQGTTWTLVAIQTSKEVFAPLVSARNNMLIIVLGTLSFIAVAGLFLSRSITKPISKLTNRMSSLSTGSLDADVEGADRKDEIGEMAKAVLVFKQNAEENVKSEIGKQARIKADKERSEFLNNAIEEFKTFSAQKLDKVNIATSNLEAASQSLSSSAEDMSEQSRKVQANVDNTSTNVSSAAAATEEMSASISEISERAASSTTVAQEAKKKTKETVDKIATLSESAKQIEQVVKLINEIAEQTNLLALNATIESARAGDAGRGFAVVANEVKSLAEQTSKATDQIATQIASIQQDSSIAAKAIADVEEVIASLAESSIGVAAAVEEQSSVIGEISSNVANASNLSSQSAESMGVVTDIIGTAKDISGDVSNLAADMKTQVGDLENDITEFLRKVSNG